MSCSIVINQQVSPNPDSVTSDVKIKDPKCVEAARKG